MELIQEYLEKIQKVDGIWLLKVPDTMSDEELEHIYDSWKEMYPEEHLIILPEEVSINKLNKYSFYIALMLIRGNKKVTRLQWMKEYEYSKSDAPYLVLDNITGEDILVRKFPTNPDEDEFFLVTKEDLDGEDYVLVE